jgi:hypothetical protein
MWNPSIKYQIICAIRTDSWLELLWLNIPNIDTLSLIPISGQRTYFFSLKPLGANEIKLPESDDFMDSNQD